MTALIIHGHFYQPPRENPWTGEIDLQPSAAPYHDWNERVHSECYGPNAFAHIGSHTDVINNYKNISFNFGPTLLSWLQKYQRRTYQRIIEADFQSAAVHKNHGNAIAQAYGHAILPLCNARDQLTQISWGVQDFSFRFGRYPESLWLPETACNDDTLGLMIDHSFHYVVLAPDQAGQIRSRSDGPWITVGPGEVDTTRAYKYFHKDGSDRSIAVFFYHGGLSRAIAFEGALSSSRGLVDRFIQVAKTGQLVNLATDGETYGHHFKFGDLCLAHALEIEARQAGFWITNYGEYLDHHPPEFEVELNLGELGEGTSWSCAHGVGRWARDCGCHTGGEADWNQLWREPLRAALNFLRDNAAEHFEIAGADLFRDSWVARNQYVQVMLNPELWSDFLHDYQKRPLSSLEESRARALLEIQRNALLMFTSCGWFFSDLAGIETIQIMRYAARLIDLQNQIGFETSRTRFLEMMAEASSNDPAQGNGAEIFLRLAEKKMIPEPSIAPKW
jgi:alpha-amylase/alpha-mannosidase (GH57 family)